jgi:PhnB protein
MAVKFMPDGYSEVTPFITVDNAGGLIEFLGQAFGARTRYRIDMPGGNVGHAELTIGSSVIMIADPDERGVRATASLHLYVEDVDRVFKTAVELGARNESEPETQFYGDRSGCVVDAWGNRWYIATHVEDVSEEELHKRMAALAPA